MSQPHAHLHLQPDQIYPFDARGIAKRFRHAAIFGALDALTRAHLQDEVMRIQNELKNTVVMITHDVDEAVLLSDRIVMMTNGPSATIGQILNIDLPRPRDRLALADDPTYNHYRHEVLSFLHEKQRKVEAIHKHRLAKTGNDNKVSVSA